MPDMGVRLASSILIFAFIPFESADLLKWLRLDSGSSKSTDSNGTKIRIEDASRLSHAHVKHHASDRQFVETDEADSTEKKARASRRWRETCAMVVQSPPPDRAVR